MNCIVVVVERNIQIVAAVRSMTGFWKKNKRNFQNGGFGGFSVVIFKMQKASVEVLDKSPLIYSGAHCIEQCAPLPLYGEKYGNL